MLYDRPADRGCTEIGPTTNEPTMVDDSHARQPAPPDAPGPTLSLLGVRMDADPLHAAEVLRKVKERMFDRRTPPTRVGRYELRGLAGSGGMGVVYRAYDPDLQRLVALKSLRDHERAPAELARLRREAQSLAMLSHPNVVGVHGLVESDYGLFVVMELVEGPTLGDWLVDEPRAVSDVLRVFRGVGRGLAAAHAAGLVHRDVKPSNVLLDAREEPKVVDFGLARGRPQDTAPAPVEDASDVSMTARLTRAGAVVGTPWYMPPEQFEGGKVDARSDQFAFCVSLYEALYRTRPFVGRTAEQRLDSIERGALEEPSTPSAVPSHVHAALVRGLKADPGSRWPDMNALVDRLRETRSRRGWIITLGVLGVGGLAVLAYDPDTRSQSGCDRIDAALEGVWDRSERRDLERAFVGAGGAPGAVSWPRLGSAIDTYAQEWRTAYGEVCRARDQKEESSALFDRRMTCLRSRRQELGDAIAMLTETTPSAAGRATEVILGLTAASRCLAPPSREVPPPSAAQEDDVAAIRGKIAASRGLERLARYDDARGAAREALDAAEDLGYVPLTVEARLQWSASLSAAADYEEATEEASRSYWVAADASLDRLAAKAAIGLIDASVRRGRYESGAEWAEHAQANVARLDEADDLAAALALERGELARAQFHFEEALEHFREAHRLRSTAASGSRFETAEAKLGVGGALAALQRYEEAHEIYADVAAELEALLGPRHPTLGRCRSNLGVMAYELGEHDEALEEFGAALDIYRVTLGEDHPRTGRIHAAMGAALARSSRTSEARRAFEEALRISQAAFGEEHPRVVDALNGLAGVLTAERHYAAAAERLRQALAIQESMHGEDSPRLTALLGNLANAENGARNYAQAQDYAERALRLVDSQARPIAAAELELHLAVALLRTDETRPRAAQLLEQAAKRLEEGDAPAGMRRFLLITQGDLASRERHPEVALAKYDEAQRLLEGTDVDAATLARLALRRLEAIWAGRRHDQLQAAGAEALRAVQRAGADATRLQAWLAEPGPPGPPVRVDPAPDARPP